MTALSPAVRRFAALGLTLVAAMMLIGNVILPAWGALFAASASLRDARFQDARLRRQGEALAGFDARAAVERRQQLGGYVIEARHRADAQAALEDRLRQLLSRPGITVETLGAAPAPRSGAVRASARASVQERAFIELIGSLETGLPLLTVEALDAAATENSERRDLAVTLTVAGYWSPGQGGRP